MLLRFSELLINQFTMNFVTMVHETLENLLRAHGFETLVQVRQGTSRVQSLEVGSQSRLLPKDFFALGCVGAKPGRTLQSISRDTCLMRLLSLLNNL